MSSLLPLFLNLSGRHVLLVGGGSVALAKLQALLETEARITVVALHGHPQLWDLVRAHRDRVTLRLRPVSPSDLDDVDLVVSATNDPRTNRLLQQEARRRRLWVNAVDDPANGDVVMASRLKRGPFQVAICSGGAFPGLSRALRLTLEEALPEGDLEQLERLAEGRARLKSRLPDPEHRSRVLRGIVRLVERGYFGATS